MPVCSCLFFGLLGGKERGGSSLESPTIGVTQHKNQLGVQSPSTELQTPKNASLSVGACVASITQNKEISGQSIKNSLQWHSWISASHNSSVGCLALQCQCLSHAAVYLSDQWSSYSKALIPFLQHLHGQVWFQSPILRRPYRVHSHRWRNWQLWGQELILTGRTTKELHSTCLQMVDATLNIQLSFAHQITQWFGEL